MAAREKLSLDLAPFRVLAHLLTTPVNMHALEVIRLDEATGEPAGVDGDYEGDGGDGVAARDSQHGYSQQRGHRRRLLLGRGRTPGVDGRRCSRDQVEIIFYVGAGADGSRILLTQLGANSSYVLRDDGIPQIMTRNHAYSLREGHSFFLDVKAVSFGKGGIIPGC
ncbi:hypothetical protein HK405_002469 [Cladochytrium tenue]|nr:hypothetical protein HK405_002469 [Cladochytrium tenue]